MKTLKSSRVFVVGGVCLIVSLICVSVVLLTARDPFYHNVGEWDTEYLPLIKPYKAVKFLKTAVDKPNWKISSQAFDETEILYAQIYDVRKIAVENNTIMAYSPDSFSDSEKRAGIKILYWFVIVPDKKIETGFETEDEFLTYIHTFGIQQPKWVDPDVAFEQFFDTGCLDWIPDCN